MGRVHQAHRRRSGKSFPHPGFTLSRDSTNNNIDMDVRMLQRIEDPAHEVPGLACRTCAGLCGWIRAPCNWICGSAGQPGEARALGPGIDLPEGQPRPTRPEESRLRAGWDVSAIEEAWNKQIALARETYAKFDNAKDAAVKAAPSGSGEIVVGDEHFADLRKGTWFVRLDQDFAKLDGVMRDGTSTPVHPKKHLRTIDFHLQGEAQLNIVDVFADDLASRFPGDDSVNSRAFARCIVTIPCRSFPLQGSSRFLVGGQDGHRLAPTLPIEFRKYWNKKACGYSKFGPTFVQSLDSFSLSQHPQDKLEVHLCDGKTMIMPLADKTRPIQGGEKVVVRGSLLVENLQRLKFLFPKQKESSTLLYESVDGYLEDIALSSDELQISLLVPHQDDVSKACHSHPFGQDHPSPIDFYHHHNSYSRMFNLDPMTGQELVDLAGADRSIALPAGTIMEHTFCGIIETATAAAIVTAAASTAMAGASVAGTVIAANKK